MARAVFAEVGPNFVVDTDAESHCFKPIDIVLTVIGNTRNILTAEGLMLNCMQRMSGIATHTCRKV